MRRGARGLALLLLLALGSCRRDPPATATPPAAPPDSLTALDPATAYQRALALGRRQRFTESLPYFRHALAFPTPAWQPHCDFAITLFHAALETRMQRGRSVPVARSTFERVAMTLEAARELDRAEALAANDADRAFVIARRARHLAAWGFPRDALLEYERAARLAPGYAGRAGALEERLRDPLGTADGTTDEEAGRDSSARP